MRQFLQALSFLTILPAGRGSLSGEKELARSMAFYPLAGLVLGFLLYLGYWVFSLLFPKPLALWATIGLLAFLTRSLHLDGFADTIDGLASGGTKEHILEVMRDSRIGSFGVIGLIFLIGAKYFSLDQLPGELILSCLILMTVMGRHSMVLVCYRSPYARSGGGLAKPFTENLGPLETAISAGTALGIVLWLGGVKGIFIFSGVTLFSLGYRLFFVKKLGGVTGDILGAANEVAELLCLVLLVISDRM